MSCAIEQKLHGVLRYEIGEGHVLEREDGSKERFDGEGFSDNIFAIMSASCWDPTPVTYEEDEKREIEWRSVESIV